MTNKLIPTSKPIQADNTDEAVQEIVKRKSNKNSPVIGDNGVQTNPGDNSKIAGILLDIHHWGEVDKSDAVALEKRFWEFVDYCNQNDIRITNQLAYYAMGLSKENVYDYENRSRVDTHSHFIKKVKSFCATYREILGANGKLNPITLVWWQKNYDGFVDNQQVTLIPGNPLGPGSDAATIQKQIEALPVVEVETE